MAVGRTGEDTVCSIGENVQEILKMARKDQKINKPKCYVGHCYNGQDVKALDLKSNGKKTPCFFIHSGLM